VEEKRRREERREERGEIERMPKDNSHKPKEEKERQQRRVGTKIEQMVAGGIV
jgi:hypothetical protein